MDYELAKIDSLIENYLSPISPAQEQEILDKTDSIVNEIEIETKRIKKSFGEHMFSLKNDKQVERYIQRHQSCLIRLCDSLIHSVVPENFRRRNKPESIKTLAELQSFFYVQLEQILSYIETYFGKYFNQEELIPSSYRIIGQLEFREKLSNMKTHENCEVLKIARYPIDEFLNQNQNISFKQLIYLKELYKEVISKCSGCKEHKPDCKLSCSLIYINFNSFRFFSHLTTIVKEDIQSEQDLTKKIEKLSFHQKKLNQAQLKPNFSFKPKQESIKDKVGNWIYEEMAHYEKVRQLSLHFPIETSEELAEEFKLSMDMPVSHVAYFIRLMVETGMIQNKNQKEVITFFANHVKSKKTEQISASSLHNKYYNIDINTKDEMRERIIKLLNETQKPD